MRRWLRHRSVPSGALLTGSLLLFSFAGVLAALYLAVVLPRRGEHAATAGLAASDLARPPRGIASFAVDLQGPTERQTPRGTRAAAYRWAVYDPSDASRTAICAGQALDELRALQRGVAREVGEPATDEAFRVAANLEVPERVYAVCPSVSLHPARARLRYIERTIAPGAGVHVIGCAFGEPAARIRACDGGPSVTILSQHATMTGRKLARARLPAILVCAGAYTLLCLLASLITLRLYARMREVPE